jgi:pseudouridine synthase
MQQRLQKIIAAAGVASRRKAEEMILEGAVRVNGKVVTELGFKADPDRDAIKVRGKLLHFPQVRTYILLYKPRGYVTTLSDPEGRPTVRDLVKGIKARVYPVGRLDYDTEGLLLMTDDGDLAHHLMHPSHDIEKSYIAKVKGVLEDQDLSKLTGGVRVGRRTTAPAKVFRIRKADENSWIEVVLHEGRNRQVRRMLEQVGHPVLKLKRIRYAFLTLEGVPPGHYRRLTKEEVERLKAL